ncbi:hypothetical protein Sjap_000397 [Stephania japonica]|uniref:Uncharacterized protein n=1 Tax=Stephania japonica TaxID=461633 RepID=A0AAP0PQP9_9MAGN
MFVSGIDALAAEISNRALESVKTGRREHSILYVILLHLCKFMGFLSLKYLVQFLPLLN